MRDSPSWGLQKTICVILLIAFSLAVYLPSLKLKFSLLDDGLTILNSRLIFQSMINLDFPGLLTIIFEPLNGRVRPIYWLAQSLMTAISLENSHIFHFWRLSLLVGTMFVAYEIMLKLKIHFGVILFAILLYIFNIQNLENYYRLGPVEPFIVLILILIFNLLFFAGKESKYTHLKLIILNFLGIFIKENFFMVGLVLLSVLFFPQVRKVNVFLRKILLLGLSSMVFGICVFAVKNSYPILSTDYASNYVINIQNIVDNVWSYVKMISHYQSPFFELSLVHLCLVSLSIFKKGLQKISNKEIFLFSLWIIVISQIFILSPWKFILNRYISFININLILIYAMMLSTFVNKLFFIFKGVNNRYTGIIVILIFTILYSQSFVRNYFNIANYQLYAKTDSEISYGSIKDVAEVVPNGTTLYVNYKKGDANIELFEEMGWHLNLFYHRDDIKIEYLDESNLCTSSDRFIFDRRSERFHESKLFMNESFFTKLIDESSVYRPINYGVVIKSFIYRYKYEGWNDEHVFDWSIYLQKGGTCLEYE